MTQINKTALQRITGGDDELLADVAVIFVRSLSDLHSKVWFGVENHEAQFIEEGAHQLSSRVAYFGAESIFQKSKRLESAARSQDFSSADQLSREIFEDIDTLLEELRELTGLALDVRSD